MSEQLNKFIKFVAQVIAVVMIFFVIFAPQGIVTNTFNFMAYAEPIILQDYLSTVLTVASYSPGDFKMSFETSGKPHEITISDKKIKIKPAQQALIKTDYATLQETSLLIECELADQVIKLKEKLVENLEVRKISDDTCELQVNL